MTTGCATAECGWDGGDCNDNDVKLAPGSLVIIVAMVPENFTLLADEFVRSLSMLLRSVLRIKQVRTPDACASNRCVRLTHAHQTGACAPRMRIKQVRMTNMLYIIPVLVCRMCKRFFDVHYCSYPGL